MLANSEDTFRIATFVQREGELLDLHAWDEWLQLYEPECEYWIPMWDDDTRLTTAPRREPSLIYYDSRAGLEDRAFRIKAGHSAASTPLFRTAHMRSMPLCEQVGDDYVARFPWTTHAYRLGQTQTYFGRRTLWLSIQGDSFRIRKSHAILYNDLINDVFDIYHV